jgi:hypothetical protein
MTKLLNNENIIENVMKTLKDRHVQTLKRELAYIPNHVEWCRHNGFQDIVEYELIRLEAVKRVLNNKGVN